MEYIIHLLNLICIYLILAQSFNLVFGLGMLFNLSHISLYAIGAYTTALLSTEHGFNVWECLASSMVLAALFSPIVSAISSKLVSDYFAVGTMALHSVVVALLINWKSLTHGVLGIPGIPRPEVTGIDFYTSTNFLFLALGLVIFSHLVLWILFRGSFGRALRAQAEFKPGAESIGINSKSIRAVALLVSALFAGLAGGLFAYFLNYIDPSSFALSEMIFVLTIVIVGRPGSFWGVTAGTVFMVLLPEPLRFIGMPPSILGPMRQLIWAILLFLVVYWNRAKLFPVKRAV